MGFIYWVELALIFMTWPLNFCTRGAYSPSGSQTMMSSSVASMTLAISLFAENDFPDPGVPRISPLGFLSFFLSAMIRLLDKALSP